MKVTVICSIFGGYDQPVFVEQTVPCEYVLITDGEVFVPDGWSHQVVDPCGLSPRLMAKRAKCEPWNFADSDIFVWIDGSILPTPVLVESMLESLGDSDIAFHTHPERGSIIDEAHASIPMRKYNGQDVLSQAKHYVDEGHPDDWGLWASTLFAVRDTPQTRLFGRRWMEEIERWTIQDQLPLPVILREVGLNPSPLKGGLWGNPLFGIRGHKNDL